MVSKLSFLSFLVSTLGRVTQFSNSNSETALFGKTALFVHILSIIRYFRKRHGVYAYKPNSDKTVSFEGCQKGVILQKPWSLLSSPLHTRTEITVFDDTEIPKSR